MLLPARITIHSKSTGTTYQPVVIVQFLLRTSAYMLALLNTVTENTAASLYIYMKWMPEYNSIPQFEHHILRQRSRYTSDQVNDLFIAQLSTRIIAS